MFEDLSIGQKIAKERKKQKKSIVQIAEDLKIQESYLQAIEKDDYTVLPGKAYIAGFIKSYAEYLSLEYDDLLKMLRATQDLQEDYHNMPQELKDNKKTQKVMFSLALVMSLLIVAGVNYYNQIFHEIKIRKIEEKTSKRETLEEFFDKTQKISAKEDTKSEIRKELLEEIESLPESAEKKGSVKVNGKTIPVRTIMKSKNLEESEILKIKKSWGDVETNDVPLHYQKSKPPFAKVLLKANKDVWFQIRPLDKKRIYVSRVLPQGKYYWVTPWNNVVIDVSDASSMEVIVNDKLLGALGPNSKRIRGAYLDVKSMEDYFINGENLNSEKIENY